MEPREVRFGKNVEMDLRDRNGSDCATLVFFFLFTSSQIVSCAH